MSKLGLHPEVAYEELMDKIIALGKEYGVDITDAGSGTFLNDLYDQCYDDLHENIKDDEED